MDRLRAKPGVFGRQLYGAGLFPGADPNRARSTDQRKRIVSDQSGRAGDREDDRIIGERANGAKLIRHPEHNPCGIGPIRNQGDVIRNQSEFAVDAGA